MLAYQSNETGTTKIYVVSFPEADDKRTISDNGGVQPRWRKDGKELYYLSLDGKLMAVNITSDTKIDSDFPRVLFDTALSVRGDVRQYEVTPDGERFLFLKPLAENSPAPISVVLNWTKLLENK